MNLTKAKEFESGLAKRRNTKSSEENDNEKEQWIKWKNEALGQWLEVFRYIAQNWLPRVVSWSEHDFQWYDILESYKYIFTHSLQVMIPHLSGEGC